VGAQVIAETPNFQPDLATALPNITPKSQATGSFRDGRPGASRRTHSHNDQDHKEDVKRSPAMAIQGSVRQSLKDADGDNSLGKGYTQYGSIIGTPPSAAQRSAREGGAPSLDLPDPALDPEIGPARANESRITVSHHPPRSEPSRPQTGNAYEVGETHSPTQGSFKVAAAKGKKSFFASPGRGNHGRVLARPSPSHRASSNPIPKIHSFKRHKSDVNLGVYKEVQSKQDEFFTWMDGELDMIESFYKQKEDEASERLRVLREQLHIMRDRRMDEVLRDQRAKTQGQDNGNVPEGNGYDIHNTNLPEWLRPVEVAIDTVRGHPGRHPGKNTQALAEMDSPPHGPQGYQRLQTANQKQADRQDYTRRDPNETVVPYRTAKRKLKAALQEFYRGLELLKSYTLLNRTAFRKMQKKYDKTVHARPTGRYMSEKVNKAWFVNSDIVDGQLVAVEDLYARYFERGNHKLAVGKLRSKKGREADWYGSVWRAGLTIGAGLVFGIQGIVYGAELLFDPDPTIATQTSYLMQVGKHRRHCLW
jgi:xenotropic and polytropic retrovirus receptor 1